MTKKVLAVNIILLFMAFSLPPAYGEMIVDETLAPCKETFFYKEDDLLYPGTTAIAKTNNLRRKTGFAYFAKGKEIFIKGRVLDRDCLPVTNAIVEIWHVDADGNSKNKDKNFAGSGQTFTNNLGEFGFITVYPGIANGAKQPYVHFKVYHAKFGSVFTRMYLPEKDNLNMFEMEIDDISMDEDIVMTTQEDPYKKRVYTFDIKLDGRIGRLSY